MPELYFLPMRPAFDSAGAAVSGSRHYFTLAGGNVPSAPYQDAALTIRHSNPVVSNGAGYLPPVYLDPAITYRVRIYGPSADDEVPPTGTPLEEYDPYTAVTYVDPASFGMAFTPDDKGAKGDGITDDTGAFQRLATAVNAVGGGLIELRAGATYLVGGQTFGPAQVSGRFTSYTGVPQILLELAGLTRPLIIRGNGARIKARDGLKYGTFSATGLATSHSSPFFGAEIATPYPYMISLTSCTSSIRIENLELDGNIANTVIGGPWGDTGIQVPYSGLFIDSCTGGVEIINVNSHHHGLDGMSINGSAVDDRAYSDRGRVINSQFNYNGRLGTSLVGGRGWKFEDCNFNWNANTSVTGSTVSSSPGSGCDFEAEGGRVVRDVLFRKCDLIGNQNTQAVADSGTPVNRVSFEHCRLVATAAGSYAVWANNKGMSFHHSLLAGTVIFPWGGDSGDDNPFEAFYAYRCTFSNSNDYSPTGTTASENRELLSNVGLYNVFRECLFDHDQAGAGVNGGAGNVYPLFDNCTFRARQGGLQVYGRFRGTNTRFFEFGSGTVDTVPQALVSFKANAGDAEDSWVHVVAAGTQTRYPATVSAETGARIFNATATYDPPSLAIGAKDTIRTMTVTGVSLGDKVDEVSFSNDLAGARIHAWVSGTNTVSYYAINDNGANPLDLASGTLRIKVVGA